MPLIGGSSPVVAEQMGGRDPSSKLVPLLFDSLGNLKVSVTGAGSGGTSSNFGDTFPAAGTAAGFIGSTGNMAGGTLDAAGYLKVNVAAGGAGGGAVTVADGADVAEGATTDAAVLGDNAGTVSAKLRGVSQLLNDVISLVSHYVKVQIQNATIAVTQSGTWTVQPGNTANTTAWKVDGSAVTQPVSAASLPLPTGASTLAKQPALGTAGTASADVISVQGIASMTPLLVNGSGVTQPVSGTVTANAGTNLNTSLLALEAGGNLASILATLGATSGAKVITDANGTIQQYLRGVVYLLITAGAALVTATGSIDDDGASPGKPVTVAGWAISPDGTDPGSVSAEGDVSRLRTDLNRRTLVNVDHPNHWSYHNDGSSALSAANAQSAPGAGFQICITGIAFSTNAATACTIFVSDSDGNKVMGPWALEAVAGRGVMWRGFRYLPANKGLTVTTSQSIAQSTDIQGFIQAV